MERGLRTSAYAEAYIAGVPIHFATRELEIVGKKLSWPAEVLQVRGLPLDMGPGNVQDFE